MPMSLNQVQLCGNLGRDPEIRQFNNGGCVASLSIATNKRWKDRQTGEPREKTEWHRVDVIQQGDKGLVTALIEPYLKKGDSVFVQGELRTDKWQDQSGQDRYTTKIAVAGPQHIVAPNSDKRQANGSGASSDTGDTPAPRPTHQPRVLDRCVDRLDQVRAWRDKDRVGGFPQTEDDLDDEIPF
jgi:single-strand DNA-binding protein